MGSGPGRSETTCLRPRPERVGRYSTVVMAAKTKAKAGARTGSGKGARRTAVKRSRDIPLLPIAAAGILLAFAIGIIIYIAVNNKTPHFLIWLLTWFGGEERRDGERIVAPASPCRKHIDRTNR